MQRGWFFRRQSQAAKDRHSAASSTSVPLLLVQIGKYVELIGKQAKDFGPLLGLTLGRSRPHLGVTAGFPVKLSALYQKKALGLNDGWVSETGSLCTGIKKRAITKIITFTEERK